MADDGASMATSRAMDQGEEPGATRTSGTSEPGLLRASDTLDQRKTFTVDAWGYRCQQTWRQVGWLGQSGTVYPPHVCTDESGGFTALWVLVEDHRVSVPCPGCTGVTCPVCAGWGYVSLKEADRG